MLSRKWVPTVFEMQESEAFERRHEECCICMQENRAREITMLPCLHSL